MVERESGHWVKTLRTDNGGQYTSMEFKKYLKSEGVRHELTIQRPLNKMVYQEILGRESFDCCVLEKPQPKQSYSWCDSF